MNFSSVVEDYGEVVLIALFIGSAVGLVRWKKSREWSDRLAHKTSVWINHHWIETALMLLFVAVLGGWLVGAHGGNEFSWNRVSIYETCLGVVLAIGIFLWTVAGFAVRHADTRRRGAEEFARRVGDAGHLGRGPLSQWHREELAAVLKVPEADVENELLLWLIAPRGTPGGQELLVVTQRLYFLRLTSRGRGGRRVSDLSTGRVLRQRNAA